MDGLVQEHWEVGSSKSAPWAAKASMRGEVGAGYP